MNKTGFPKTKRHDFSSPYLFFVIILWKCLLTWVQTTSEISCVNFFMQYGPIIKLQKLGRNFPSFGRGTMIFNKISKKLSRFFFQKFHIWISTEFGIKRKKFYVKRMSIHLGKKSKSFTHKWTFLLALTVMNTIFIPNPVAWIWGSNLSHNSIDTMTNVWK